MYLFLKYQVNGDILNLYSAVSTCLGVKRTLEEITLFKIFCYAQKLKSTKIK